MKYRIIRSGRYAWNGIKYCCCNEKNFRVQFLIAGIIFSSGFYFRISSNDWILILFCSSFVLSLEMINTAIDKLSDRVSQEIDPVIKQVKDIAAGAVLVSSAISLIGGILIFLPKIKSLVIK